MDLVAIIAMVLLAFSLFLLIATDCGGVFFLKIFSSLLLFVVVIACLSVIIVPSTANGFSAFASFFFAVSPQILALARFLGVALGFAVVLFIIVFCWSFAVYQLKEMFRIANLIIDILINQWED